MEQERIVSAANMLHWKFGTTLLLVGVRHWDSLMHSQFKANGLSATDTYTDVQGFITNKYRFVDRKEAFAIAHKAGQILFTEGWNNVKEVHGEIIGVLYSENLY